MLSMLCATSRLPAAPTDIHQTAIWGDSLTQEAGLISITYISSHG
jgi:hypothetical protein